MGQRWGYLGPVLSFELEVELSNLPSDSNINNSFIFSDLLFVVPVKNQESCYLFFKLLLRDFLLLKVSSIFN